MELSIARQSFHAYADAELVRIGRRTPEMIETRDTKHVVIQERSLSYRFHTHAHPFVPQLVRRLIQKSVRGLQEADTDYQKNPDGSIATLPDGRPKPVLYADLLAQAAYGATSLVEQPLPVKELDFSSAGAYAGYNWEVFFHVPLTIAMHLSKNQRYAEAMHWFHHVFDPTDDSDGPTPARFWRVRPFQSTDVRKIEEILTNLSTGADAELRKQTIQSIEAWKDAPFRPHVVARYRPQAYMLKTVMAYLDNLIDWGDSLFAQDTGESLDEAVILYVMAANILGPQPQAVPQKGTLRARTYANLREDLDKFGNTLTELETDVLFDTAPHPREAADNERMAVIRGLGRSLYFCVPRNAKLLGYWDTVADRLFKLRNSLNLQGVFRQLPLFEPPIDPALLARAAASGLDVGAIVSGLNQPLSLLRFPVLVRQALDICHEVKALGGSLLAAIEREDAEALSILRARHERVVLEMAEHAKYGQWQEAIKAREGLLRALDSAIQRYTFYERQLGKQPDEITKSIPELAELDAESLAKMQFASQEPVVTPRPISIEVAANEQGTVGSATLGLLGAGDITGGHKLNRHEAEELDKLELAHAMPDVARALKATAELMSKIPQFPINLHFWGIGGTIEIGGKQLADAANFAAEIATSQERTLAYGAGRAGKLGAYSQRERDWALQSTLAAGEINQIFSQLRAAQIREAVAERELNSHRRQIAQSQEIEFFLTGEKSDAWTQKIAPTDKKIANKGMHTWMKREVKSLQTQCFQFAFEVAKKAERALWHELGRKEPTFIQHGYLAGKEGLLAGEKLWLDVKRMELAYLELNQREYELTTHASLMQLDPVQLVRLRATGRCTVKLPEALFDLDGAGHYFRRIKSVAVTLPCVTGPYTGVHCRLTLQKNSVRTGSALRSGAYAREDAQDDRFDDDFASLESIVTSSGVNDSGLFETDLHGDRRLPFENAGVVSEWQLELPSDPSKGDPTTFDYQTISDVVLHVRYTARDGGSLLREAALTNVKEAIRMAEAPGCVRLFSLRHEFASDWSRFLGQRPAEGQRSELVLKLRPEHFPFWSQGRLNAVDQVEIYARSSAAAPPAQLEVADKAALDDAGAVKDVLAKDKTVGNLLVGRLDKIPLPDKPVGELRLFFDTKELDDVWLALTWKA